MKKIHKHIILLLLLVAPACDEIVSYPDTPVIEFRDFTFFPAKDALGNEFLLGRLEIDFTDGDGNVGMNQPSYPDLPDSLKYNLFLRLHEYKNGELHEIEGSEGALNFRVPFMERKGQNKTLKGTISVDIEYKVIDYEAIAYTFYLMDRAFNRSNVDTSRIIYFTGLEPVDQ